MKIKVNLINKKFGRLSVIKFDKNLKGVIYWLCKCDCGKIVKRNTSWLTRKTQPAFKCSDKCILYKGLASFNWLYKNYKQRAKQRNYKFKLTKEEFGYLTKQNCVYCGESPNNRFGAKRLNGFYYYNGLDRKNNKKGYNIFNCVSCCKTCNFMKNTLNEKAFLNHVKKIINHIN